MIGGSCRRHTESIAAVCTGTAVPCKFERDERLAETPSMIPTVPFLSMFARLGNQIQDFLFSLVGKRGRRTFVRPVMLA